MKNINSKQEWSAYCDREVRVLSPILAARGYSLDEEQPHLGGERFLMYAITTTSGRKLILIGHALDGERVVIKASREPGGVREIEHARRSCQVLERIDFARDVFHAPREIAHFREHGFVVNVQTYIEQKSTFLERPLKEQFALALSAFKGQEGAHATTWKHRRLIGSVFGIRDAETYLENFHGFVTNVRATRRVSDDVLEHLHSGFEVLTGKASVIEQYAGFLTHTDFVPHNIRISDGTMYLLDHSSLTFGNKYEGWARFMNFMALYNPPLTEALTAYVTENRTPEESVSLRVMRIYRLGELIWYYVRALAASEENLEKLNDARIAFWNEVLWCVMNGVEVPASTIAEYTLVRDTLRSDDEKRRQVGLH